MVDENANEPRPDWDQLYDTAAAQAGHFTTAQAAASGYSSPLLHKHLASRRLARVRRGVYRLVHFPLTEHEQLVVSWLWAEQAGVFSHETALALHDLSDVLPASIHMTLPQSWRQRRLRVPDGVVLHYAVVDERDRSWMEAVPITSPERTLRDCIDAHASPDLVRQAIEQACQRGLVSKQEGLSLSRHLDDSLQAPP